MCDFRGTECDFHAPDRLSHAKECDGDTMLRDIYGSDPENHGRDNKKDTPERDYHTLECLFYGQVLIIVLSHRL